MNTKEMVKTAERLEEDAKKLREAADILEHNIRFEPSAYNGTRAEQLESFIREHGGAVTRTEIVKNSGIPHGTIASLLGSNKRFFKDAKDNWHIKPAAAMTNGHHQQPNNHHETAVAAEQ